jgi:hypothetical protein
VFADQLDVRRVVRVVGRHVLDEAVVGRRELVRRRLEVERHDVGTSLGDLGLTVGLGHFAGGHVVVTAT